jgi:hypothetical protein
LTTTCVAGMPTPSGRRHSELRGGRPWRSMCARIASRTRSRVHSTRAGATPTASSAPRQDPKRPWTRAAVGWSVAARRRLRRVAAGRAERSTLGARRRSHRSSIGDEPSRARRRGALHPAAEGTRHRAHVGTLGGWAQPLLLARWTAAPLSIAAELRHDLLPRVVLLQRLEARRHDRRLPAAEPSPHQPTPPATGHPPGVTSTPVRGGRSSPSRTAADPFPQPMHGWRRRSPPSSTQDATARARSADSAAT